MSEQYTSTADIDAEIAQIEAYAAAQKAALKRARLEFEIDELKVEIDRLDDGEGVGAEAYNTAESKAGLSYLNAILKALKARHKLVLAAYDQRENPFTAENHDGGTYPENSSE